MLKMDVDYMDISMQMENNTYIVKVNLISQTDCIFK